MFKTYALAVNLFMTITGLFMTITVGSAVINLNHPNYKPTAEIVRVMRGY